MTRLQRLFTECGQSPWLDNLTRAYLRDGTLARMVADGIRGVTANPTIFARAIEGSAEYDEQFRALVAAGRYRDRRLLGARRRRRRACVRGTASDVRCQQRNRRLRVDRGRARSSRTTPTATVVAAPRVCTNGSRSRTSSSRSPATAEGYSRDPRDDRGRSQHQRHAHLLARRATQR